MPKKDFPNNFNKYQKIPAERFKEVGYEDFMEWKVQGWELPDSVTCIIRADNMRTNKVQEYVYQRHGDAVKRIDKLMEDLDNVITICDNDEIHLISARDLTNLLSEFIEESDGD